jgi:lactate dehydrogenase-like 2-hydroxyacid dehydrogenase
VAHKLLLVSPMPDTVTQRAVAEFDALVGGVQLTIGETIAQASLHQVPALLISARMKLRADDIERLPSSVHIVATCSVGYDHIAVEAARARGIWVTNTPEVLTAATADLTMMLILCACRRAREYDQIMRAGWRKRFTLDEMLGVEVNGRTLGILGMGRIGRAVAKRAVAFDMRVLYHDVTELPAKLCSKARYVATLEELLPNCDVLSLHTPGNVGGPLMTREMIRLLPKGAVLVNAARGSLVDEDALFEALKDGHLFAAGLDVYRSEPDYDLRFNDLPNVFLTPHVGSATVETRHAMGMCALNNVAAALSGARPPDAI